MKQSGPALCRKARLMVGAHLTKLALSPPIRSLTTWSGQRAHERRARPSTRERHRRIDGYVCMVIAWRASAVFYVLFSNCRSPLNPRISLPGAAGSIFRFRQCASVPHEWKEANHATVSVG